jgi:hypothetical protein
MPKKTDLAVAEKPNTDLALSDYGTAAGDGFQDVNRDHVTLPFLNLLQALSPEIAGDSSQRVEDAKIGQFINSVSKELFDSVLFQPVAVRHVVVEWRARDKGGGKVAEHAPESQIVTAAKASAEEWNDLTTDEGNTLEPTFYLLGLIHRDSNIENQTNISPEPIMLSLASTKIKPYRNMMTRLTTFQSGKVPLYAHRLRIKSIEARNAAGQPFRNILFEAAIENNIGKSLIPATCHWQPENEPSPLLAQAKALRDAYVKGNVKTAEEAKAETPF